MNLVSPRQAEIDWLTGNGVEPMTIIKPVPIMIARGIRAADGRFEPADDGQVWFAFETEIDLVFWRPKSGQIAVDTGRCFALGQDLVDNPGATALGAWLRIFASPLHWLQANRNGLYILPDRWPWAYEWLKDVERVAVAEELLSTYRKHMRPRLPALAVLPRTERIAA